MEYIMSMDAAISLITGAIIGGLAAQMQVMKNLGLITNILIGAAGGLIGGFFFDWLDILNVGDIADPAIAGLVGSVIVMAIVYLVRRQKA